MQLPFRARVLVLFVTVILAFVLGAAAGYYAKTPLPNVLPDATPLAVTALIVFAFGFLFFGYTSPIITFFIGITAGNAFKISQALTTQLVLLFTVSILAAFASIRLGEALLQDLSEQGNFREALKISLAILVAALIAAGGADLRVIA